VKRLSSLGVSSVFKMSLVLGASAGVLAGLVLMVAAFIDGKYMEGVVTLVLAPILYGVIGAVVNALMAWLYNKVAERLGGIELHLED
jgi:hypothetical protein